MNGIGSFQIPLTIPLGYLATSHRNQNRLSRAIWALLGRTNLSQLLVGYSMEVSIDKLQIGGKAKRLSGAQMRKLKKEKQPKDTIKDSNNTVKKDAENVLIRVVVPVNYPDERLSKWQTERLQTKLIEQFCAPDDRLPVGDFIRLKGGLKLACDSQSALDRLGVVISSINISGVKLKIIDLKDLPVYTKIILSIPGDPEDPDNILERLDSENEILTTKNWRVIHDEIKDGSQIVVFSIDENSLKHLESLEFKPVLKLNKIKVKPLINRK